MKTGRKWERIYTRVIKFLAWQVQERRLYTVSRIDFSPDGSGTVRVVEKPRAVFTEEEVELLQYTNLPDMHGKDIYEGFVVRDPELDRYYEVLYRADRYMVERRTNEPGNPGYELADLYDINEKVEVVGTIFEHPDLLRKVGYEPLYEDDASGHLLEDEDVSSN
jgi:YopX protein